MNILLLGSGGRECTLAWKLHQSKHCDELFIAPGNAGTTAFGTNINLNVNDFLQIKKVCIEKQIDILIPGSEDPLVAGIWDFIKNDEATKHIIVAGPSKAGAILEGSKAFSKEFMERYNIPTAKYKEFNADNYEEGILYIQNHPLPIVLKADGLAAGKGVIIAQNTEEALHHYEDMVKNAAFGDASSKVVIEEFLDGIELSVFVFTDGKNYVILPEAKDYKRIGEGDMGPNTGGMGAISPVPFADNAFMQKVTELIIDPTIEGLQTEDRFYQGFIFFGLINVNGNPMVIEYNCRMGDPETEVVIPRLKTDLVEMIMALPNQDVDRLTLEFDERTAATVMLVSGGYPGVYEKGKTITGLDYNKHSLLFHAGTQEIDNKILTNGGRVMAITSLADNLQDALKQSYEVANLIDFDGKNYRKDIGYEFI